MANTTISVLPGDPLVQPWFDVMHGYADQSFNAAFDIANDIYTAKGKIIKPDATTPKPTTPGVSLGDNVEPNSPKYISSNPTHPGNIQVQAPNHLLAKAPVYDLTELGINIPPLPVVVSPDVPEKPRYDLDKEFPEAIDVTYPDLPEQYDITLPIAPDIDLPTFNEKLPPHNVVVPGITY